MGLALVIARRSLVQRPGRTLFSILGVAIGIATVVCTFTLDHATLAARAWVDPSWQADLEVRAPEGLRDPRAALEATPGVAGVAAYFQNEASVRRAPAAGDADAGAARAPEGGALPVQVVAIDAGRGTDLGAYHVARGRDVVPVAEGPQEVLVGAALAAAGGLEIGDALLVARPRRAARTACVEGEIQTIERTAPRELETELTIVGVLAPEGVGRRAGGRVLVVDYQVGRALFQGALVEPRFWIKRDAGVDLEELEQGLGRDFSYEVNQSVVAGQMEDERAFRNGVRMAGLLALMLGLYVIFHTLSMSLIERVREVATLDALGASRAQIARVFFLEAVAIALAAGALGIGLGLWLARALLARGVTTLGVQDGPVELRSIPWGVVGALAAIGVGVALLGSVYPLWRARGADTVGALRGEGLGRGGALARGFHVFAALLLALVVPALYFLVAPAVGAADAELVGVILGGLAVAALLVALPLAVPSIVGAACAALARPLERAWPLAGRIAARSMRNGPARVAASVAAIALVTAAFVGLRGMTNSLQAELATWGEEAVADKVFVGGLPPVAVLEVAGKLRALPEVVAVETGDARAYVPFLLIGLDPAELARRGPLANDAAAADEVARRQGIVVSKRLARHRDLSVGDSIAIHTSGHGVQAFRVAAITDAYGWSPRPDERMYGVIASDLAHRYFCLDVETTTRLAVALRPGADPGAVRAAVLGALPADADASAVRFETGADVLAFHRADLRRDFVLFDVILGLSALLAGVGVLNGQLLAALERAKDLGVLRALGTSRAQIAGMVWIESLVLGATGGAIGCAVGSALTPPVVRALEMISGLPLPLRGAGPWIAWCFLGAILLTVLAALYPIHRLHRMDPVRAVRTG